MSLRNQFPAARISSSHFFVTVARGDKFRALAIRPWVAWTVGGLFPVFLLLYLAATSYLVFHDDMLSALMKRQTQMQYAYEDRLAAMRTEVDRANSGQLLDQNRIEGRVHDLLSRQAQIESRAGILANLANQAGVSRDATASISRATTAADPHATVAPRSVNPLLAGAGSSLPAGVSAFAPVDPPRGLGALSAPKPQPEAMEVPPETKPRASLDPTLIDNPDVPVNQKLAALTTSLDVLDNTQVAAVRSLGAVAKKKVAHLRGVLADAGLSGDRRAAAPAASDSAVGGPFVPIKASSASPFEREVYEVETDVSAAAKLRQIVDHSPLHKPLAGDPDVTSPFGARIDPFLGKAAIHPGIDLRDPTGTPVRVTGAGKVTNAGWSGGYGNMVEVDHGGGVSSRYGHLSAINVEVGQSVTAGELIGRVGATGRATGPHLHYEVRVDGQAVDPSRFLKVADRLYADNGTPTR